MKSLRNLIKEKSTFSISGKNIKDFFETEIKNYELFSEAELKSYFDSEKFLKDLYECYTNFCVAEDEGLFQFFVLKNSDNGITLTLDALSIQD